MTHPPTAGARITRIVAAFVALSLSWVATPAASGQAGASLPPARDVIDRFVKAIGGRAALLKYRSRRAVGTFEVPAQGLSGALDVLAAAPDRLLLRITLPGVGEIENGFDGTVAWLIDPMTGPRVLEGRMRDQMRIDADFYSELHDPAQFKTIETMERTTFEGAPAYRLRLVRPAGDEDIEFFAVGSGLLTGAAVSRESPMGPVQQTSVYSDYKEFGGVLIATRIRQRTMGVEQVLTFTRVEFDTVGEAAFAVPPQIKALVR